MPERVDTIPPGPSVVGRASRPVPVRRERASATPPSHPAGAIAVDLPFTLGPFACSVRHTRSYGLRRLFRFQVYDGLPRPSCRREIDGLGRPSYINGRRSHPETEAPLRSQDTCTIIHYPPRKASGKTSHLRGFVEKVGSRVDRCPPCLWTALARHRFLSPRDTEITKGREREKSDVCPAASPTASTKPCHTDSPPLGRAVKQGHPCALDPILPLLLRLQIASLPRGNNALLIRQYDAAGQRSLDPLDAAASDRGAQKIQLAKVSEP